MILMMILFWLGFGIGLNWCSIILCVCCDVLGWGVDWLMVGLLGVGRLWCIVG